MDDISYGYSYWNPWDLIYLTPVVIGWYIALVFYLLHAQTTLSQCSAESRTMAPRAVWLAMIPGFGFAWVIVVSLALTKSLENELRAKKVDGLHAPAPAFGITAGGLFCLATVFMAFAIVAAATSLGSGSDLGDSEVSDFGWVMWFLSGAAGLVLWVLHWAQANRVASRLFAGSWPWKYGQPPRPANYAWPQPAYPAASPAAPSAPPSGDFCSACGRHAPGVRFCPQCGKERKPA